MNNVKTAVLLALMTGLLMVIGQLVAGRAGLMTAIGIAIRLYLKCTMHSKFRARTIRNYTIW